MMRKVVVFTFICLFNLLLINGINFANRLMLKNDFIIRLNSKVDIDSGNDNNDIPSTDNPINTEYEGESIAKITNKFEKYFKKTSLAGYGEVIASSSIKKGVNPYLVGGIILVNTNCINDCTIIFKNCNNVGDIKGTPGCFGGVYKKYDNVEASINDLVDYVYDKFVVNNLTSPNAIYKKYGKDVSWAFKVTSHMEKLKKIK